MIKFSMSFIILLYFMNSKSMEKIKSAKNLFHNQNIQIVSKQLACSKKKMEIPVSG